MPRPDESVKPRTGGTSVIRTKVSDRPANDSRHAIGKALRKPGSGIRLKLLNPEFRDLIEVSAISLPPRLPLGSPLLLPFLLLGGILVDYVLLALSTARRKQGADRPTQHLAWILALAAIPVLDVGLIGLFLLIPLILTRWTTAQMVRKQPSWYGCVLWLKWSALVLTLLLLIEPGYRSLQPTASPWFLGVVFGLLDGLGPLRAEAEHRLVAAYLILPGLLTGSLPGIAHAASARWTPNRRPHGSLLNTPTHALALGVFGVAMLASPFQELHPLSLLASWGPWAAVSYFFVFSIIATPRLALGASVLAIVVWGIQGLLTTAVIGLATAIFGTRERNAGPPAAVSDKLWPTSPPGRRHVRLALLCTAALLGLQWSAEGHALGYRPPAQLEPVVFPKSCFEEDSVALHGDIRINCRPTLLPGRQQTPEMAIRACATQGKRVCMAEEWQAACSGLDTFSWPSGNRAGARGCRQTGAGPESTDTEVACLSPLGIHDMDIGWSEWVQNASGHWELRGFPVPGYHTQLCASRVEFVNPGVVTHLRGGLATRCCSDAPGPSRVAPEPKQIP